MSTENLPTTPQDTTITFTPESYSRIAAEAKRHGLSPRAYVSALSAVQSGRVSPDMLKMIGEIFRHDRETLRELAK